MGVTALLTPKFEVFIEYRRTDVDVDITDAVGDKLNTSLQANHVNGGVTLRF